MPSTNTGECDGQDMSQTDDRKQTRQTRIDTLLKELAVIRQARPPEDVARRRLIEAELVVLLDAEIASRKIARSAEPSSAGTSN
jgi:hypothetical protein